MEAIGTSIPPRLGFDATVTENVKATLVLVTGADDPRGTNQTRGGTSSRKQIGLDLAYADWRFMPGGDLVLGKQPYPVWRPLQSIFLDPDINPVGGAVRFNRGPAFAKWQLGAYLGRAADAGSWEVGAMYQSVDKDALFGQATDSDFGDGRTDAEGRVFNGRQLQVLAPAACSTVVTVLQHDCHTHGVQRAPRKRGAGCFRAPRPAQPNQTGQPA